jgi:hypothetical protein
VTFGPNSVKK